MQIQIGGVDLARNLCQNAVVAAVSEHEEERETAALKRAKTLPEKDLVAAAWQIYRMAKSMRLTIAELAKKADGNFRSFNNWKQAHEAPKLAHLQKFAEVVGVNVRVVVQDAASENVLPGAYDMSEDALDLASEIDKMTDEERTTVRAFIAGMRAKARPSDRAEVSIAGASRGPRK